MVSTAKRFAPQIPLLDQIEGRLLAGVTIPLPARIVAAADVFDALASERTYKTTWSPRRACEHIFERGGSHFARDVASCFGRC